MLLLLLRIAGVEDIEIKHHPQISICQKKTNSNILEFFPSRILLSIYFIIVFFFSLTIQYEYLSCQLM